MFSILPRRRSPVLLRKALLRVVPAVALSCLGSSLALIISMASLDNTESVSTRLKIGALYFIFFSLFPLLVLVHHMFRPWRWRYWLTILELLASLTEVTIFIALIVKSWNSIDDSADSQNDLDTGIVANTEGLPWLYPGSFILLAFVCVLSLLALLWDIASGRFSDLFKPYYCLGDEPRPGWTVLVGVSAMRKRYSTDRYWLVLLRACVAAMGVLALILAGTWMILGEPLNQISGSVEIRTFYNVAIPSGTVGARQKFINLLLGSPDNFKNVAYNWTDVVDQSLNVTVISEELTSSGLSIVQTTISCDPATSSPDILQHAGVYCPLNLNPDARILKVTYLISFDFSLLITGANDGTLTPDLWASVYLGFSEEPLDVYLNTVPVYLFPGGRILGQAEMVYRDMLKDSALVILGLPSYRRILVARVYSWPIGDDGVVPLPNNNTGAAKISPLHINPVRYERDYLAKSIFGSFAALGGIWTFINGIFAIVFGSTLVLILFDQKPLSIYGLIHNLRKDDVTHLRDERPVSSEEQQRIIGLIRDHLLDIKFDEQQKGESEVISTSPEKHGDTMVTQKLLPRYSNDTEVRRDDEELEMRSYPKS